MRTPRVGVAAMTGMLLASCAASNPGAVTAIVEADPQALCARLADNAAVSWPDASTRVISVAYRETGPAPAPSGPPGAAMSSLLLPAHCEVTGVMQERTGVDGQQYAVRFHLRLPGQWNGRFFMQGGGGTNGELGDAIGRLSGGAQPALVQGYAVLSQDSGHDNATNTVPERGGASAFGFDPKARADYGRDSLQATTLAAKALAQTFYGSAPRYSYFVGCSKGGQEGMALAQQYPDLFDGIVATAPGFSLPRAAVAEAWNTKAFASVPRAKGLPVTNASLAESFSMAELGLAREAVLEACDADDGLTDGIVGAFRQCTSDKVLPQLKLRRCSADSSGACLSDTQISALESVQTGPRTSAGAQIYPGFPWDAGWSDMGWRIWMIGAPDGSVPAINVAMGGPSLAAVFTSPPRAFADSAAVLDYMLGFNFDRDTSAVDAVVAPFSRSAWDDISARSSNLDAFRQRRGKLIVPHGVSDPVFSINDTIAWWEEVNARYSGKASETARVFPVPGMGHCQGGPATDQFDAFSALVRWVEQGDAPISLDARAGQNSPWPGRARPLCPHPLVARPVAGKDTEFECRA